MKHAMCNIHINDYYSKYFVYNGSNLFVFHCDFTYNLLYDRMLEDIIFSVLSDVTKNASCLIGTSAESLKTFQYISFE